MTENTNKKPPKSRAHLFQPGQSGNPAGRPKGYAEFRELCRDRSPKALETLDAALDAGDVVAVRVVLEYAWGKPSSAPEDLDAVKQANPFSKLSLEELHRLAEKVEED
jgi:hypothetical protein